MQAAVVGTAPAAAADAAAAVGSAAAGAVSVDALPEAAAGKKTFVNHNFQEVTPIDWHAKVGPNAAYENILTMLNALPRHEEGLVFGFPSDIEPDAHFGFRLAFNNGHTSKGAYVAVLIACSKKSNPPESFGQDFKLLTPNVSGVANELTSGATQPTCDPYYVQCQWVLHLERHVQV